jgi:large subunit ribosomal protein L10
MRPEKQFLLDEIKEKIDQSSTLVWTKYRHMSPNLASAFRFLLGDNGGGFKVVRKRLLVKAAERAGIALSEDVLAGHIGVVFTDRDPVSVTKVLFAFSKENDDLLEVLGGRFEGQLCTAQDIKSISELPSKDEMRAQLLGTLEAPMSQTLAVVEALLTSVIHCLENKTQQ